MICVVTGPSSGIGQAICKKFSEQGWTVIGISRYAVNKNDYIADVSNYGEIRRIAGCIEERCKVVDLLVNCARIFKMEPFVRCKSVDITKIVDTNLIGMMNVTHAFLPILRGRVINISSVAALHGIQNQAIYAASKAGMEGFANALALEGVNVCTIYPGGVNTPLWNESNPYQGDVLKLLDVEDVVSVVEFVARRPAHVVIKKIVMFPESEQH